MSTLVYKLVRKAYIEVAITDLGVFAKDQVPDDYGGIELHAAMTLRMVVMTSAGDLIQLNMEDLSQVMDKNKNKGIGATGSWELGNMPDINIAGTYQAKVKIVKGNEVPESLAQDLANHLYSS